MVDQTVMSKRDEDVAKLVKRGNLEAAQTSLTAGGRRRQTWTGTQENHREEETQ